MKTTRTIKLMEIKRFTSQIDNFAAGDTFENIRFSSFAAPSFPAFVSTAAEKLGPGYPLQGSRHTPGPALAIGRLSATIPGRTSDFINMLRLMVKAIPYRKLIFVTLCLLIAHLSSAQFQRYPIQKSTQTASQKISKDIAARPKAEPVLTLPFFDDFSRPYKGMYPDTVLWDSSFTVWINEGTAINAPTINVATFDGLNSEGLAYEANEILLNGLTDSLVSNKINMSEAEPKPVTAAERSSVFLSFFYQWQGNGEAPNKDDYIQVEFKNNLNKWETVLQVKPLVTFRKDTFYTAMLPVTGNQFFHKAFQFRFRTFGRRSGPYDTWNIDYVYLNKGRNVNDVSFPDRAMASALTSLFHPYTSIPYEHFLKSKNIEVVEFDVKNLKNFPASTNYKARAEYKNYVGGSSIPYSRTLVASAGVKGLGGDMEPYERVRVKLVNLPDPSNSSEFNPDADSLELTLRIKVISNDSTDTERFAFGPINLQVNDTASYTHILKDYYAYDDGVAEYAAGLIAPGNLSAYAFEIPEGIENVLLKGFDIYVPPNGISSNQTIDFFIYDDADGEPGEQLLRIPARPVQHKRINEFQTISFLPAQQIMQRKFYIGWKEPVTGKMLVGLDINNDTSDKMFVNTNGSWERNNRVRGTFMIRPLMGTGVADPTTSIEKALEVGVYPNPTKGSFTINGQMDKIEILSITGQPVKFDSTHDNAKTFIRLNQPAGLYLLRCTKDNVTKTQKLILSP